jgi:mannose-6-phosphate isomerase-like protein (cupin superfamily)
MKNLVWRVALLGVLGMGCGVAEAQTVAPVGSNVLARSEVFGFDEMPVRKMVNGGESRDVLHGELATGEVVAVHESMQPAGAVPVVLHTIQHSELIMVQEGTVGFEHDGKVDKVGAGSVIYVALGTLHRIKNVGDGPAKYFVVEVGGDTKR